MTVLLPLGRGQSADNFTNEGEKHCVPWNPNQRSRKLAFFILLFPLCCQFCCFPLLRSTCLAWLCSTLLGSTFRRPNDAQDPLASLITPQIRHTQHTNTSITPTNQHFPSRPQHAAPSSSSFSLPSSSVDSVPLVCRCSSEMNDHTLTSGCCSRTCFAVVVGWLGDMGGKGAVIHTVRSKPTQI
jgi:hypothetical protein